MDYKTTAVKLKFIDNTPSDPHNFMETTIHIKADSDASTAFADFQTDLLTAINAMTEAQVYEMHLSTEFMPTSPVYLTTINMVADVNARALIKGETPSYAPVRTMVPCVNPAVADETGFIADGTGCKNTLMKDFLQKLLGLDSSMKVPNTGGTIADSKGVAIGSFAGALMVYLTEEQGVRTRSKLKVGRI